MQSLIPLMVSITLLGACSAPKNGGTPSASAKPVFATVETEPVASATDAADDPAIWVHPTDPARSLIIGTDKKKGLEVYDLSGKRVQSLPDGRMNNVDIRYDFPLGAGRKVAIVAATNRTDQTLALYAVDANGRLSNVADGKISTGMADPYGLCMYRSSEGEYFVFANDGDSGIYKQWLLEARGDKVGAREVREFVVGSQAEGCAADDGTGHIYIAEEDVGLWRYFASPNGGDIRTQIDSVGRGNLTDDAEGVAIFYGEGDDGYLIVSSQVPTTTTCIVARVRTPSSASSPLSPARRASTARPTPTASTSPAPRSVPRFRMGCSSLTTGRTPRLRRRRTSSWYRGKRSQKR